MHFSECLYVLQMLAHVVSDGRIVQAGVKHNQTIQAYKNDQQRLVKSLDGAKGRREFFQYILNKFLHTSVLKYFLQRECFSKPAAEAGEKKIGRASCRERV